MVTSPSLSHLTPLSQLSSCLGSAPSPSSWSRLRVLSVAHCDLRRLGDSLQWTPGLARLDCSHNKMADTAGLELLSQLTHLNISYNRLDEVPTLHPDTPLSLLLLSYNNIEQLGPLSHLQHLVQSAWHWLVSWCDITLLRSTLI